ncbi:MAG TPA: hypothetical protein VMB22_04120 [Verrucomicrobiae bacterium]|nr:hypothetical protein [Verrucomicrobiae bacterium]
MKFALAILVYTLMAVALGVGILMLVHGNPWFLAVAVAAFIIAFGKLGCQSH